MSFLKKLKLSELKSLLGTVELSFFKNNNASKYTAQDGKIQDILIDNHSLEDMSLRTIREKICYLVLSFKKQDEIIELSKTDAYHINTLKVNADNDKMSDKDFRDLFRNTDFNQASIRDK